MKKKEPEIEIWEKTDIKIFILFLLDAINYPLDYGTIHDIIAETGLVRTFDFTECFSELTEFGHIYADTVKGETYYMISDTGRRVAAELQSELHESIRERSTKCAMRLLSLKKRGAHVETDIEPGADGHAMLHLRITERQGTLLEISLSVASESEAERMRACFVNRPEQVYRAIQAVLNGKIDYLFG